MSQRRVTISDVAKLAGVSYQTVSRVINNNPNVSVATRQRVQEIVTETGYRPSHIARSLVTARTATIGLIVPDISNPFFSAVARGADRVASKHGYSILLCTTDEDASREIDLLNILQERYVDGVIVCGSRIEESLLKKALSQFQAVVLVNRRVSDGTIPGILVDDVLGAYMITQHLLQIGHRAIGFIAGPTTSYSGNQRLTGYKKALAGANIELQPGWVRHCLPTTDSGEETTNLLLNANPELSALFCYNDLVALGALRHCAAFGYQVPADIAVTGFDDIMLAGVVTPSLTTCHIPRVEIGSRAVTMLLDRINDKTDRCNEIVITPELVIRNSTVMKELANF